MDKNYTTVPSFNGYISSTVLTKTESGKLIPKLKPLVPTNLAQDNLFKTGFKRFKLKNGNKSLIELDENDTKALSSLIKKVFGFDIPEYDKVKVFDAGEYIKISKQGSVQTEDDVEVTFNLSLDGY